MRDRNPRRGIRPSRRLVPSPEGLDARIVLSASVVQHSLGPVLSPVLVYPRVTTPGLGVVAHEAANQYLAGILGPVEMLGIQGQVEARGTSAYSALSGAVLAQPFIHSVLSSYDTYQLLNSSAMRQMIGFDLIEASQSSGETVTYLVPRSGVTIGTPTSLVEVPANGGRLGFIAQVPTENIRIREDGLYEVAIPVDQIPADAAPPIQETELTGSLSIAYDDTGEVLAETLKFSAPLRAPNAPNSVPGLRLVNALSRNRYFAPASLHIFLRQFRIAVDRGLFESAGGSAIQNGLDRFLENVNILNQQGAFNPDVPPAVPATPPRGPLGGTLAVSVGSLRDLVRVADESRSGLQIPEVGNFDGRIDAGFVFDRQGNYGLILTARGPMFPGAQPFDPPDLVGGDLQVQVSNAPTINDLSGLRTVEAVTMGAALMGSLTASSTSGGLTTFAASAGYGAGFEYGAGTSYTEVIPLGNLLKLIPQFAGAALRR